MLALSIVYGNTEVIEFVVVVPLFNVV